MGSLSFLHPLVASTVALLAIKAVFVSIFPAAPIQENADVLMNFVRPSGEKSLFLDVYDIIFGWAQYIVWLAILYCPWKEWVNGSNFRYSRLVIFHVISAVMLYTVCVVAPYIDTFFKEQVTSDWFLLVKRPSILIGWIVLMIVEFYGEGPNHWSTYTFNVVLSINVLEAALLGYSNAQYPSALVLFFIVFCTPNIYVDRENYKLVASKSRWNKCLSPKWYYRLYCLALLSFGMLNIYFARYGLMVLMTLMLPLMTAEVKMFHSAPETRFENYTEIFSLFRFAPLVLNCFFGVGLREVWYSYFDSNFRDDFTFVIDNTYIRNGLDFAFLAGSILFLMHRDNQEALAATNNGETKPSEPDETTNLV